MPDPIALSSDAELRAVLGRALAGGYDLDSELGRGGMGIVYRARDKRLKRTVAIKLLPPELAFRGEIKSRFLREAETAAQLSHPNIVPIYSVDERDGLVYFVMACVEGPTLARRLHDQGRIGIDETRRIVREVAEALAYANARGVVHRDIKPDNILLDADTGRAMVTDFGIARAVQDSGDSRLTATGVAIGTPAYMSPEQAAGDREIDGRSDLYALGIVAYQMLTGELPFKASSTPTMLMKHLTERPMPVIHHRPDVPPDLDAVIMTLLEKEPERRFANASALVAALQGDVPVNYTAERSTTYSGQPLGPPGQQQQSFATVGPYIPPATMTPSTPQPHDIARWNAEAVHNFRSKFAKFAFVNGAIVLVAMFGGPNGTPITAVWAIYIAAQYSKLWSNGYDWRDVFRQPRDRQLLDVASETIEDVRGVFDKSPDIQARRAARRSSPPMAPMNPMAPLPPLGLGQSPGAAPYAGAPASQAFGGPDYGRHSPTMRQAEANRNEIFAIVNGLDKRERGRFTDVIPSAEALYQRVESLARGLAAEERSTTGDASRMLEQQVTELEAQANPLDVAKSEERVRRLALLKRQRRALADAERRRVDSVAKLERCALELQSMRMDMARLRAAGGGSLPQDQLTTLTARARRVADEVDAAVYAADEVGRVMRDSRRDSR
ncbi:MAG: serine/threonine-protein kinase [Gemmatimonadaceae bacterium]